VFLFFKHISWPSHWEPTRPHSWAMQFLVSHTLANLRQQATYFLPLCRLEQERGSASYFKTARGYSLRRINSPYLTILGNQSLTAVTGINLRVFRVGFAVKKLAVDGLFFESFGFPRTVIPLMLHTHYVSSGGWAMGPLGAAAPQTHDMSCNEDNETTFTFHRLAWFIATKVVHGYTPRMSWASLLHPDTFRL
jgi:hypothetical protein